MTRFWSHVNDVSQKTGWTRERPVSSRSTISRNCSITITGCIFKDVCRSSACQLTDRLITVEQDVGRKPHSSSLVEKVVCFFILSLFLNTEQTEWMWAQTQSSVNWHKFASAPIIIMTTLITTAASQVTTRTRRKTVNNVWTHYTVVTMNEDYIQKHKKIVGKKRVEHIKTGKDAFVNHQHRHCCQHHAESQNNSSICQINV